MSHSVATPRFHATILVCVWFFIHVGLWHHYGLRTLNDSVFYLEAARFLATHGYLADADYWFYSIPMACLALCSLLTDEPGILFVIVQSIVSGLATLALYKTAATLFGNARSGLMAAALYILWWDMIHWNVAIMTESFGASSICFVLYTLVHFRGKPYDYLRILLCVIVAVLTRPTGILVVPGVLIFFALRYWHSLRKSGIRIAGIGLLTLGLLLAGAHYMFTHWDFTDQYGRGNIVTYADTLIGTPLYHSGLQLHDPLRMPGPEATGLSRILLFITYNPLYFFKAMALKIGFLLSGMRPYYSTVHNAFTVCWNTLVYAGCIVGVRKVGNRPIAAFAVGVIVLNVLLVGISSVDWDNRFLLPMVPPLVLLASGLCVGCNRIVDTLHKS